MKTKIFILIITAAFFCACKENNPVDETISCDPTAKTIALTGGEFVVSVASTSAWSATADQSWVTVSPDSGQGDANVTVVVKPGEAGTANVLFSNEKNAATLVITRDEGGNPIANNGALPGEFSVSATTKVHFSQGNLQYVGIWLFAEHQWDCFGATQADDHRDLFGWGTGDAPNKVNEDNAEYATFVDWGVNPIANGGNADSLWRTLTREEWVYLFHTRENADILFGLGSVNGVNGTIILPDKWQLPNGVSFTASTTQGLEWESHDEYRNSNNKNFTHNAYTAEQWAVMESAGAVFLPAEGCRYGAGKGDGVGMNGFYWSATQYDANGAYRLFFDPGSLKPQYYDGGHRYSGYGVRLVRLAE